MIGKTVEEQRKNYIGFELGMRNSVNGVASPIHPPPKPPPLIIKTINKHPRGPYPTRSPFLQNSHLQAGRADEDIELGDLGVVKEAADR